MANFCNYLEALASTDYTSESDFLGQANRWLYGQHLNNKLNVKDVNCNKLNTNIILFIEIKSSYSSIIANSP